MKHPPRLLVDEGSLATGSRIRLDPKESAHVAGPLRRRVGDRVLLVDGAGAVAAAVLVEVRARRVVAEVETVELLPKPEHGGVTVAMAVVERQAMDWAVPKAVEVGVRRLVPVLCERTQRGRRDFSRQREHWLRISRQALKQCRRPWAMEVAEPQPLADFAADRGSARAVVGDVDGRPLAAISADAATSLVVGPEGGFTTHELDLFDELQWPRVRLAVHVLRTETAAVVGAALLVARAHDLI